MFSKEEAYRIKKEFWISYGTYMKLQMNAEGNRTNWVNYKTDVKGIFFRTDIERKFAEVSIEIAHPDPSVQELIYEQFEMYDNVLKGYLGEDWVWTKDDYDEQGKQIATIKTRLENVSIFRESDWPELISFLKQRMINLDEFWCDHKESFDMFKEL
ncbi:protein of unknown function [Algoriella xinjiangensis]|uniref:DUF4268 domain-containing protein n=1 Tax=Algoriella xinjiangensis TaxID=684065 RepID=A0A1I4X1Y8_9FLAO|nr:MULTISPECIES: DUF4268 domain-containing protein [Algoriella]MBO6213532.1 DUF4268 domain-containing protein [Algoriella sp.]SFN20021.1 protein of unknown function [Algoriella xinjiangensis]VDH14703.1 Uncharacterised protein [Algoriella xinjiangensis]